MDFPEHVYTLEEFEAARAAIRSGHKHRLKVIGGQGFKERMKKILDLVELAGYGEFLRTYIREIREIQGLGQLRETEATIWLNNFTVSDLIEGARFVVQKAFQMRSYLEGRPWYILGELSAIRGSIEFLRRLREQLQDGKSRAHLDETIERWTEDMAT